MIHSGKIKLGGNVKLKIYGRLNCSSGKRMKRDNRVFFSSEKEAITEGYRPCGHCLRGKYLKWTERTRSPAIVPGPHPQAMKSRN
ncbi:MAG TPA: Ada metal-binding domain-containing protein [Cyclobacteriaceae bacterium]|nr:Ada metal-binding domain-containing protein [Cyclobacteriaceae bacterium]